MKWSTFVFSLEKYFTRIPYDQQFKPPRAHFMPNSKKYELYYFFRNTIPEKIYSGAAKLFFNKNMKK